MKKGVVTTRAGLPLTVGSVANQGLPDWWFNLILANGLLLLALLLVNLLASVSALASVQRPAALVENPLWPGSGTLEWQGMAPVQALSMETDVNMQITGLTNRVSVTQHYHNSTGQWLNGRYVFPLPENAAVDSLHLQIGTRQIVGQIKARQQARQLYQQAKAAGKRASLLQQQRPNLFSAEVANLAPGETLEVRFSYQQPLDYRDGHISVRFPMTFTPRYIPAGMGQRLAEAMSGDGAFSGADAGQLAAWADWAPSAAHQANHTNIEVKLNAGVPLASLSSPSHELQSPPLTASRLAFSLKALPSSRDFVLQWQPMAGQLPQTALYRQRGQTHKTHLHQAEQDNSDYSLLMLLPPTVKSSKPLPRELVLVIDTSGSMSGAAMTQAKSAVLDALASLAPQDSFNILAFSSEVSSLATRAVAASPANMTRARRFVSGLEANGGTEMALALEQALPAVHHDQGHERAPYLRQVIFITDGAVANETSLFHMISQRLGNSRLFTVGIGSAPNGFFMRRAADVGRGTFTYIGNMQEVKAKIGALLHKIAQPVLTNVQLRYGDGSAPDYWPRQIPDLYLGEPLLVSLRQPHHRQQTLFVSGLLNGQHWQQALAVQAEQTSQGLDLLWARQQIAALEMARAVDNATDTERQVSALALKYHLVSRYTSLVAVDVTPVNSAPRLNATGEVLRLLPAGWQPPGRMPATASNSRLWLLLGSCCLLVALLLGCYRRPLFSGRE
ncbi:marine proteobacterial sortase target protein [Shewanella sp. YIC-542]|uniref:marine proteobacterial sortase target protein n=1 Tax=Shewanella mytili TaxID=3377111 RepID=UPI00398F7F90